MIPLKGIDLNHEFYVVVGKKCRTENVYTGNTISLYKLIIMFFYYSFVLS